MAGPGQPAPQTPEGCFPLSPEAAERMKDYFYDGLSPDDQYRAAWEEMQQKRHIGTLTAVQAFAGRCGLETEFERGIRPGMLVAHKLVGFEAAIRGVDMPSVAPRAALDEVNAYHAENGLVGGYKPYLFERRRQLEHEPGGDPVLIDSLQDFLSMLMVAGSSDRATPFVFGGIATYDFLRRQPAAHRPLSNLFRLPGRVS